MLYGGDVLSWQSSNLYVTVAVRGKQSVSTELPSYAKFSAPLPGRSQKRLPVQPREAQVEPETVMWPEMLMSATFFGLE